MSGEGTLDNLIQGCSRFGAFQSLTEGLDPYIKTVCGTSCVRVGDLVFHADRHSTGCSVYVWVVDGKESIMVRNTTYWYSYNYTFNEPRNIYGPWDAAISDAMDKMAAEVTKREAAHNARIAAENEKRKMDQDAVNSRFAKKFTVHPTP